MSGNVALVTNKGSWNALLNAPAISNSTRNNSPGDYYTTSVAGTSSFTSRGKGQYFAIGDIIVYNGAVWTKNDQFSVESGFGTPANWKAAYDDHIISGSFANNTITLNQKDGGSFTIDLTGVGGSSVLYRNTFEVTNGSGQNSFTLSTAIDHEDKTQVFIDGVYQQKTGYSVSGTTLTFDNSVVVPQGSTVEIISFSSVALTESLANAKIFVGDSNANAIARTVSGDATLANTGALTLNTVPIAKGGTGATSASAARTSLGLGSVATTASTDYATAAQGTKADTAHGWGDHGSGGYITGITFANVSSKPTTLSGYGITDAAPIASPTFSGSVTAGGAVRINATTTSGLVIASSSGASNGLKLYNNSSTDNAYIYNHYNGNLEIGTNNATVLTMNGTSSTFSGNVNVGSTISVQANSSIATLELIGRTGSGFGGGLLAKSSIYSETSGSQYSANLVFKTNNGSNSLTERLRLNYNGDAIFSGEIEANEMLKITQSSAGSEARGLKLVNTTGSRNWNVTAGRYNQNNDDFTIRCADTNVDALYLSPTGLATFKSSYIAANQYGGELTVGGSSTAFGIAMKYNQGGATSGTIYCSPAYTNAATTLMLGTGSNTNQLVLKGDGNVGIGTTSPVGLGGSAKALVVSATSNYPEVIVERLSTGAGKWGMLIGNDGTLLFRNYVSGGNVLNISNSDNVGIGTSSPSSKLHIRTSTNFNYEFEEVSSKLRLSALNDARDANVPLQFAASEFNFITGAATFSGRVIASNNAAGIPTISALNSNTADDAGVSNLVFSGNALRLGVSPNNSSYGCIASSGANSGLTFVTHDGLWTERMRISSTGEVSMPFQPSARAHKNGTLNEGYGNNFVTGWSLQHNIGGDLATTGSFTCSKAGRYLCTFSPMSGQTSGDVQFRIYKNSTMMMNSNSMAQGGGPWRQTTVTGVIDCAVGDVLKPAAYSSASSSTPQVYSGNYSQLSFHFLG